MLNIINTQNMLITYCYYKTMRKFISYTKYLYLLAYIIHNNLICAAVILICINNNHFEKLIRSLSYKILDIMINNNNS